MYRSVFKASFHQLFMIPLIFWASLSIACGRQIASTAQPWSVSSSRLPETALARLTAVPEQTRVVTPSTLTSGGPVVTPTPDDPHVLPTPRRSVEQYTVQYNDTLFTIGRAYQVSIQPL